MTRSPHHSRIIAACSARRTWPYTSAPAVAASCTARCPTPPVAPSTSTLRPSSIPPLRSACSAVRPATGRVAACASVTAVRQRGDGMARRAEAFRPGAGGQHADHARADRRTAAVGRGLLDDAGEVPAGTRAGGRLRQRTIDLAAVERDRGDADGDVAALRRVGGSTGCNVSLSACDGSTTTARVDCGMAGSFSVP